MTRPPGDTDEHTLNPLRRTSPFLDLLGTFTERNLDDGFAIGIRITPEHLNAKGTVHGGVIATLADISLGYVTGSSRTPPLRMVTSTMTLAYVGAARLDDYLESEVRVVRTGARVAVADATLRAAGRTVATATATFTVIDTRLDGQ